jgi:hypothetical protein
MEGEERGALDVHLADACLQQASAVQPQPAELKQLDWHQHRLQERPAAGQLNAAVAAVEALIGIFRDQRAVQMQLAHRKQHHRPQPRAATSASRCYHTGLARATGTAPLSSAWITSTSSNTASRRQWVRKVSRWSMVVMPQPSRCRSRRLQLYAAPAPSRGRGPGTVEGVGSWAMLKPPLVEVYTLLPLT